MKTKSVVIIVTVVLFLGIAVVILFNTGCFDMLFGNKGKVAATVNGERIYVSEISDCLKSQSIMAECIQDIKVDGITEQQKEQMIKNTNKFKSDKDVLDNIIRNIVILQEAHRRGFYGDIEESKKTVTDSFNMLMEENENSDYDSMFVFNKDLLLMYIEKQGITKDEYLIKSAEGNKLSTERALLEEDFKKSYSLAFPDENTDEQLEKAYNDYIDKLVSEADIVIS